MSDLKFGEIVEYQGHVYRAGERSQHVMEVISNDAVDIQNGFYEYALGVYIKEVPRTNIDAAYIVFNKAQYRGHQYTIGAEREGEVRLSGGYAEPGWGFDLVEPGCWEKWVEVRDLEKIWERRIPI